MERVVIENFYAKYAKGKFLLFKVDNIWKFFDSLYKFLLKPVNIFLSLWHLSLTIQ